EVNLDCNSNFQVWSPQTNSVLLPVEASLLQSDRLRVEVICSRLVWLFGATCSEHEDYLTAKQKLLYNWEDIVNFASKYNFRPNALDIVFSPQLIRPVYSHNTKQPTHWVSEPPCWEIFFLQLKSVSGGIVAETRPKSLSIMIWTGQPIVKSA
ncbi:MAG: hypothetical protein SAK42_15380, partial [Oscillatoria sp. PMC 1076.18]|nr:hypothetical protein [Oscillatoria sp. PMC 1076.18]